MNKWVIAILVTVFGFYVYQEGFLNLFYLILVLVMANAIGYVVWGIPVNAYRMIFKKEKFRFNYLNEDSNGWIPFWIGMFALAFVLYHYSH